VSEFIEKFSSLIEFIDELQKFFYEPSEVEVPEPLGYEHTPPGKLPRGPAGVALRRAENFVSNCLASNGNGTL
jgi:hypothetical protein